MILLSLSSSNAIFISQELQEFEQLTHEESFVSSVINDLIKIIDQFVDFQERMASAH